MNDAEYAYLSKVLRKLTKIDLNQYRSKQMRRRLDAFISGYGPQSIAAYCRDLDRDPEMLKSLQDFLTINVSQFFRDQQQFVNLKAAILPDLLKYRQRLNIWSAGCSIGAEPYSLAIILEEMNPLHKHRLLATDVDEGALEVAKAGGPYSTRDVENVPKQLLQKYFVLSKKEYWVVDALKQRVKFKRHDLLTEPYEKGFDLILCRNVVIYFTDEAKARLNLMFRGALRPGGILFVGGSEIIMRAKEAGFETVCPYFYRKSDDMVLTHV